jgi:hypothetical protein
LVASCRNSTLLVLLFYLHASIFIILHLQFYVSPCATTLLSLSSIPLFLRLCPHSYAPCLTSPDPMTHNFHLLDQFSLYYSCLVDEVVSTICSVDRMRRHLSQSVVYMRKLIILFFKLLISAPYLFLLFSISSSLPHPSSDSGSSSDRTWRKKYVTTMRGKPH